MTVQVSETLRHRGRDYGLLGTPLDTCPDAGVRERRKQLRMPSTAERRGYAGTWEIKHGRLWPAGLGAYVCWPTGDVEWLDDERGLEWLFPGMGRPVPADWFTGELESPRGKMTRAEMFRNEHRWVRVFFV